MEKYYLLNNDLNFTLALFKRSLVGNKERHPEVEHAWNMTLTRKFKDWHCERFWVVTKGCGHAVTTFGSFDVREGHAYYIPASTIIETHCDDFMEQYFINFVTTSKLPLQSIYEFKHESNEHELVLKLITDIIQKRNQPSEASDIFINSAMTMLLSLFIKGIKNENIAKFLPLLKYIEKHLNEKISVHELAKKHGYSPEYFSVLFKKTFQVSPQQYILDKRISQAKHLLLSTSLPISEIAFACGYADPLYFSRIFTKQTLFSPSVFRSIRDKQ